MSGLIAGDIRKLLSIHIKPRHDCIPDQYSRIFMVKILLACTIILGLSHYQDNVACIIPEDMDICNSDNSGDPSCKFIQAACWIQGMYVYKQLLEQVNHVSYFGMPRNIDHDGMINGTEELCALEPGIGMMPSENCVPMEKTFYLQYQWMVFFIGTMAIIYYLPYVIFCKVNHDLIVLRLYLKEEKQVPEQIIKHYFRRSSTSKLDIDSMLRPLMNVLVKVLYICVNFISFFAMDNVLNGEFTNYGIKWIEWTQLTNTIQYDYLGTRTFPKPGNKLLPPFGYCEFYESAKDVRTTKANKYKLVCEITQHILYQYCLLILWFCFVFGMIISILGLLNLCGSYLRRILMCKCRKYANENHHSFTLRELEYMEYIKKRDSIMHDEILSRLNDKSMLGR